MEGEKMVMMVKQGKQGLKVSVNSNPKPNPNKTIGLTLTR